MSPDDGTAVLAFARKLSPHDILYMRRDITVPAGIDMWLRDLESGRIHSILAWQGNTVMGYATINLSDLEWTQHIADLRVSVASEARGCGLGRALAREAFNMALDLGIEKIFARMTPDQTAARTLFQELGFEPEALLRDHVKDRQGQYHDLLMMAFYTESLAKHHSEKSSG